MYIDLMTIIIKSMGMYVLGQVAWRETPIHGSDSENEITSEQNI